MGIIFEKAKPDFSQLPPDIGFAACFAELPKERGDRYRVQILPAGKFTPNDGRPMPASGHWYMDDKIAAELIEALASRKNGLVIDYEHQTLNAKENGKPAPAAGWMKSLEWVDEQGLFAIVELTGNAQKAVQNGEYKYFSPVFMADKRTGHVKRLAMGALTNHPGLDNMQPIEQMVAACSQFNPNPTTNPDTPKDTDMSKEALNALCAKLGIKTDGREDAAIQADAEAAIAALQAKGEQTETQALSAQIDEIKPDPSKFVPIEAMRDMQNQLNALTASHTATKVESVVTDALAKGQLLESQAEWARDLGNKDFEALTGYLKNAPALGEALTQSQTNGQAPETNPAHGLSTESLEICKALGMDDLETFAKNMKEAA